MIFKYLLKKPMLAIGILFMFVFLSLYGRQFAHKMGLYNMSERLKPTSCRAVMIKLKRNIPANWRAQCEGNNLAIDINYPAAKKNRPAKGALCKLLYRELANYLKQLASPSVTPTDNLERTDIIRLKLIHPRLTIRAISEGKYVANLSTMRNPTMIAEHLKVTVQVQEEPPTCNLKNNH